MPAPFRVNGVSTISITPFAPDPATGGDRIQVLLVQNGQSYSGVGSQVPLVIAPPNQPDGANQYLIFFTLRDSWGRVFLFRGTLQTGGIAGKVLGSGRYEQVGVGDLDQWTISG